MSNIVVDSSRNIVTAYQRELNKIVDTYIPNHDQSQNLKLEIAQVINKMYQEIIDIEMGIADCMLEKKEVIQQYPIVYIGFDVENTNTDSINKRNKVFKDFMINISSYCSLSKSIYYDEINDLNKKIKALLSNKSEILLVRTITDRENELNQTEKKPKSKTSKTKDTKNEE